MNQLTLLLWIANIVADSLGQLAFKAAASRSADYAGLRHWQHMFARPWLWLGIVCYLGEFLLWLAFLTLVPLSVGVMMGSIGIVVIMLAGRVWFHETLSAWRLTGILLISLGVAVVGIN